MSTSTVKSGAPKTESQLAMERLISMRKALTGELQFELLNLFACAGADPTEMVKKGSTKWDGSVFDKFVEMSDPKNIRKRHEKAGDYETIDQMEEPESAKLEGTAVGIVRMNLLYKDSIDTLISVRPCFEKLKNMSIWEYDTDGLEDFFDGQREDAPKRRAYRWKVFKEKFFDFREEISILPVMVIGKTGYGKSSLLNCIIGKSIFPTDDVQICTTKIDAAIFRMGADPQSYLALSDLPGIGESSEADRKYMDEYAGLLRSAASVIYVVRADQRDFTIDEHAFKELFQRDEDREKVIIALNFTDKIEPINRSFRLSEEQLEALEEKIDLVSGMFQVDSYRIFPCCAQTGYGVEALLEEVTDDLENCVFEEE